MPVTVGRDAICTWRRHRLSSASVDLTKAHEFAAIRRSRSQSLHCAVERWRRRAGARQLRAFSSPSFAISSGAAPDLTRLRTTREHANAFERAVTFREPDGSTVARPDRSLQTRQLRSRSQAEPPKGRRKGDSRPRATCLSPTNPRRRIAASARPRGLGRADAQAKPQAEEYARALPTSHGWPPFIHRLRCRALHRGLCRLHRAGKELHPVPRSPDLSHLPRRLARRRGPRTPE